MFYSGLLQKMVHVSYSQVPHKVNLILKSCHKYKSLGTSVSFFFTSSCNWGCIVFSLWTKQSSFTKCMCLLHVLRYMYVIFNTLDKLQVQRPEPLHKCEHIYGCILFDGHSAKTAYGHAFWTRHTKRVVTLHFSSCYFTFLNIFLQMQKVLQWFWCHFKAKTLSFICEKFY